MKKILTLIASMVITSSVWAEIAKGSCGTNVTWSISDDYTITISGSGEMKSYMRELSEYAPWRSYREKITKVVIEEGITSVGRECFYRCYALASVSLPETLINIGTEAFRECKILQNVNIPNSVTQMGYGAFYSCENLESITLGNSLKTIGSDAFKYCKNLTEIRSNKTLPPTCATDSYNGVDKNQTIVYVPKGSKQFYEKAVGWSDFICILEEDSDSEEVAKLKSEIETLTSENQNLKLLIEDLLPGYLARGKKLTIADVTNLVKKLLIQVEDDW